MATKTPWSCAKTHAWYSPTLKLTHPTSALRWGFVSSTPWNQKTILVTCCIIYFFPPPCRFTAWPCGSLPSSRSRSEQSSQSTKLPSKAVTGFAAVRGFARKHSRISPTPQGLYARPQSWSRTGTFKTRLVPKQSLNQCMKIKKKTLFSFPDKKVWRSSVTGWRRNAFLFFLTVSLFTHIVQTGGLRYSWAAFLRCLRHSAATSTV